MPKIFLVEGSSGQYEDYRTWIVGARRTEAAAKALAKACKLELDRKFTRLEGILRTDLKLDPGCVTAEFEGVVKESKKAKAFRKTSTGFPPVPPKQRWYHGVDYGVISTTLK